MTLSRPMGGSAVPMPCADCGRPIGGAGSAVRILPETRADYTELRARESGAPGAGG